MSLLLQQNQSLPRAQNHGFSARGAYERHLEPVFHTVGKVNTQTIERKHLTLRTRIKRLARKTLCFSKSPRLPDVVIGLFINCYEFGLSV